MSASCYASIHEFCGCDRENTDCPVWRSRTDDFGRMWHFGRHIGAEIWKGADR